MKDYSYYCTWAAQNYMYGRGDNELDPAELEGDVGAAHARGYMTEETIFGENGLCNFYPEVRKHLYFVLDDGWDVPKVMQKDPHLYPGGLVVDEERFPNFTGKPWERLAKLNKALKQRGWAGLGLWIAAQEAPVPDDPAQSLTGALQEEYWKERLEWSERAGVHYWKVDWGAHGGDMDFRRRLTAWGKRYAPNLTIEQAVCQACYNDDGSQYDVEKLVIRSGNVDPKIVEYEVELLQNADVLRSYDVFGQLSVVQTIARVAAVLEAMNGKHPEGAAILNCEDECMIGASLGLSVGIMRHPWMGQRAAGDPDCAFPKNDRNFKKRLNEVTRTVAWQQFCPPFGCTQEKVHASEEWLKDRWHFQKGETWMNAAIGQVVEQKAPAVLSRGVELPCVECEGEPPFVTASAHAGCAAIATHGRTDVNRSWYEPLADVRMTLPMGIEKIGIFGRYRSLTIEGLQAQGKRVLARDLLGGEMFDLTAQCASETLMLDGAAIERIGLSSASAGDQSCPGMVVWME